MEEELNIPIFTIVATLIISPLLIPHIHIQLSTWNDADIWYWLKPGAYAKYKSNSTVIIVYDCDEERLLYKSAEGIIEIYWKVIELNKTHAKIFFNLTLYNITSAKVTYFKETNIGVKIIEKRVSLDKLERTCTLLVDLNDRKIYLNEEYIGEWIWFIYRREIGRKNITFIKNYRYPLASFLIRGKGVNRTFTIKGIVRPEKERYTLDLGFRVLPSSRIATYFPYRTSKILKLSPLSSKLYYDIITGLLIRVDLYYKYLYKGRIELESGSFVDSIMYRVFNIVRLLSNSEIIEGRRIVFPVSLNLVDTNIPFERPVFGAEAKKTNGHVLFLFIALTLLMIIVLYVILKWKYRRSMSS